MSFPSLTGWCCSYVVWSRRGTSPAHLCSEGVHSLYWSAAGWLPAEQRKKIRSTNRGKKAPYCVMYKVAHVTNQLLIVTSIYRCPCFANLSSFGFSSTHGLWAHCVHYIIQWIWVLESTLFVYKAKSGKLLLDFGSFWSLSINQMTWEARDCPRSMSLNWGYSFLFFHNFMNAPLPSLCYHHRLSYHMSKLKKIKARFLFVGLFFEALHINMDYTFDHAPWIDGRSAPHVLPPQKFKLVK